MARNQDTAAPVERERCERLLNAELERCYQDGFWWCGRDEEATLILHEFKGDLRRHCTFRGGCHFMRKHEQSTWTPNQQSGGHPISGLRTWGICLTGQQGPAAIFGCALHMFF